MNITKRKAAAAAMLSFVFFLMVGLMAMEIGWLYAFLLWGGLLSITALILIAVCILNE